MTARTKVTLTESQRIRTKLVEVALPGDCSFNEHQLAIGCVDRLLSAGVIDTDAALRIVGTIEEPEA